MIYYVGQAEFGSVQEIFSPATIQDVVEFLSPLDAFVVDTETTSIKEAPGSAYSGGLDPYMSRIIMVQVGNLDRQYVIDARQVDIRSLAPLLESKKHLKILHNSKFDAKMFERCFGITLQNTWDTMLAEQVRTNGARHRYSMAACAKRVLGYDEIKTVQLDMFEPAEELEDMFVDERDALLAELDRTEASTLDKSVRSEFAKWGDKPFTIQQIIYGADDIVIPMKLYLSQLDWLKYAEYNPRVGVLIENRFALVLADTELGGIGFSPDKWLELNVVNKEVLRKREEVLNDALMTLFTTTTDPKLLKKIKQFIAPGDLFNEHPYPSIRWTSPAQVCSLFKALDIARIEKSKSTGREEWTVSAKALYKFMSQEYRDYFDNEQDQDVVVDGKLDKARLVLAYMLFKKSKLACTTFGTDFLKYVHPVTRKVHSSYRQHMNTGRMSSTNPNLQNIPRGKAWRKCFEAPKGKVWICADYASQESRILAALSQVDKLVSFFRDGDDIFGTDMHSFAATQMQRAIRKDDTIIVTKETDPELRTKAKSLNFALSYGAAVQSLKFTLNCSEEEAQEFIDAYFDGFPGLREDFERTKKAAVKDGSVLLDPYTGKRYFFPDFARMRELEAKAKAYYPSDWAKNTDPDKKEKLYEQYPELRLLWKEFMSLKGQLERAGLNYRIQGCAATMTKIACCIIYSKMKERDDNGELKYPYRRLVNIVHDEIIAETIPEDAEEFSRIVTEAMEQAGAMLCPTVPMGADSAVGDHWIH